MSSQNQNKTSQQNPNQKPGQQQQNPNQKPDQQADASKAELKKAAEDDKIDPNNPQGQQNTQYSGGT